MHSIRKYISVVDENIFFKISEYNSRIIIINIYIALFFEITQNAVFPMHMKYIIYKQIV